MVFINIFLKSALATIDTPLPREKLKIFIFIFFRNRPDMLNFENIFEIDIKTVSRAMGREHSYLT